MTAMLRDRLPSASKPIPRPALMRLFLSRSGSAAVAGAVGKSGNRAVLAGFPSEVGKSRGWTFPTQRLFPRPFYPQITNNAIEPQHQTPDMTRPVIHIPLIIKTPGQQDGRRVSFTADQTSLAPTILALAGVPKPDWMHGQSLVKWLRPGSQSENQGLAFTQYLERNSVFRPLHHGTLGVIDGRYQYVFYLDTQRGVLRPLEQAQIWDLDESSLHPDRVESLRTALHEKFPDIVPAK
jgi:N-sulphoglucosamine sulphohydrolase, C-terminal